MIDRKKIADELYKDIQELVIGFTASAADFMHPGFISALEESKRVCDYLVVGLQTDPTNDRAEKQKPFLSAFERWCNLYNSRYVDLIIPFDTEEDLVRLIKVIQPDIRIVGEEYKDTKHTGYDLTEIYYNKRTHDYSSTMMRDRFFNRIQGDKL